MKTILGIALCILVPATVFSQLNQPVVQSSPDGHSVSEPEFEGVFFRLVAGNLVPLEREPVPVPGNVNGGVLGIVASVRGTYSVAGGKSPVRFRAGETLEFIVRAPSATADPTDTYHLRKLAPKKTERESTKNFLPLQFSRYGTSSYRISTSGLPPGEYALRRVNAESVFCFGVD
jgi:hypothetical protein